MDTERERVIALMMEEYQVGYEEAAKVYDETENDTSVSDLMPNIFDEHPDASPTEEEWDEMLGLNK